MQHEFQSWRIGGGGAIPSLRSGAMEPVGMVVSWGLDDDRKVEVYGPVSPFTYDTLQVLRVTLTHKERPGAQGGGSISSSNWPAEMPMRSR